MCQWSSFCCKHNDESHVLVLVVSSVRESLSQICTRGSHSSWIQCWPSQTIRSHGGKAKHLSFSHLYYVAETSTPRIRVVPDHPRTPPKPHQGLQFEISDVMKKSKTPKLLTSYHDPRQPGSLGGVARFAQSLKLPLKKYERCWKRIWATRFTNREEDVSLPYLCWCLT